MACLAVGKGYKAVGHLLGSGKVGIDQSDVVDTLSVAYDIAALVGGIQRIFGRVLVKGNADSDSDKHSKRGRYGYIAPAVADASAAHRGKAF